MKWYFEWIWKGKVWAKIVWFWFGQPLHWHQSMNPLCRGCSKDGYKFDFPFKGLKGILLSEGPTPWHFHVVSLRSSPWPPPSLVTWSENLAIKFRLSSDWQCRDHVELISMSPRKNTCTFQGGRLRWLPKYVNDLCYLHYALVLSVLYNLIFVFVSCVS